MLKSDLSRCAASCIVLFAECLNCNEELIVFLCHCGIEDWFLYSVNALAVDLIISVHMTALIRVNFLATNFGK